jgi:hypothetical protein
MNGAANVEPNAFAAASMLLQSFQLYNKISAH